MSRLRPKGSPKQQHLEKLMGQSTDAYDLVLDRPSRDPRYANDSTRSVRS